MSYSEIVVTAFVVALVLFAMWRVGQLNPVGTGKLARRLNALEGKVAEQGVRMDRIESSILTIADNVGLVSREIGAMRVEVAADRGLAQRTWASMERLEGFFIEDALKGRRS